MIDIQPFDPTDTNYEAIVAIENAVWPDHPTTVEFVQHLDQTREPDYLFQRLVVKDGGRMIAFGTYEETPWSYRPGKYQVILTVRPDYERRGIGAACYDYIIATLAQRQPKPSLLTSSTRSTKPQAIRFLEKRGFQQVMRVPESRLDLSRFEPAKFAAAAERVQGQGIKIYTLPELQASDPDWQAHLYELDWICTLDEPSPDPPTRQPLEQYVKQILGDPNLIPEAWFIALDGDQYVGLAGLYRNPNNQTQLNSGFTGVIPSHRRRGIATALKLRAIAFARQSGAQTIETGNEENNPMYTLNLALGFEPTSAWLAFKKTIGDQ